MCTETQEYRSPIKKLARFFKESRDNWKRKCLEAKRRVKLLQTKVADLQASRGRWKKESMQLRSEVSELRTKLEERKVARVAQYNSAAQGTVSPR